MKTLRPRFAACTFGFLVLTIFPCRAVAEEDPRLLFARGRLAEAIVSLRSVYVEYTVTHTSQPDRTIRRRWAMAGRKTFWREYGAASDEHGWNYHESTFDGDRRFSLTRYPERVSVEIREGAGTRESASRRWSVPPAYAVGLSIPGTNGYSIYDYSIVDALLEKGVTIDESGTDEKKMTLQIPVLRARDDIVLNGTVVLNAEFGYLPEMIMLQRTQPVAGGAEPPDVVWEQRWTVEEFFMVHDSRLDKDRPFPKRTVLTQGPYTANSVIAVAENARINDELPDVLFTPVVPDDAEVFRLSD